MEIRVLDDYAAICREASVQVARTIRNKPNCVLGMPTGSTPIGMFRELVRLHREEGLDFSHVVSFNLDEYLGIPPTHAQSYHVYMREHLFTHINISPDRVFIPMGNAEDPVAHCTWYEKKIAEFGGIDLLLLGIGTNGHIAFNEPGSPLMGRTRVGSLSSHTRRDSIRLFGSPEAVPKFAITMGIGTLLEARRILLLASGAGKAEIVRIAVEGPITARVPASSLQFHADTTFLLDPPAAYLLEKDEG
ncbi:MAG: glucosamine-6-phosphate deaminase [candidate division Zixibacteria bacterium]|nr:glucosamine-6-phosphate deaminase [candidate division Zixibacteria bacterium]